MEEEGIHELAAAYVLDALDPEERLAFDAHLESCQTCREQVASLGDAAAALAFTAGGPAPPPELRGRILEAARSERAKVVLLRRRWTPVGIAAAAAAACLALGLGLWATLGTGGGGGQEVALSGARGTLSVSESGRASLTVSGLEPAPAGKAYEIWVIEGTTPLPAGLFAGDREPDVVTLTRKVPRGATVAVTIERAGGVKKPTSLPPLFSAKVPV